MSASNIIADPAITMGGAKKKKKARPARPPPPAGARAEQLVSLYALLTACGFAGILAVVHAHNPCGHSSPWWHHSTNLTPAQAGEAGRLERSMLWCSAPQAAAAALALLQLPVVVGGGGGVHHAAAAVGGSRRALAWAALAAAAANHCMYARLHLLFVAADPGDYWYRVVGAAGVVGYAACDLLAFLALLLGRGV